ncbi:hypothetical protein J4Q44_G00104890 [Coregonus suidteri]|uniref:Uncharacterized protein n=1 Tax=Coregonus suidteri TaxID=861788 RepID=A0AAN8R1G1_9TELE
MVHSSVYCYGRNAVLSDVQRQLHAWPFIEINTGDLTHYMAPLSSQSGFHHTGFVVPELITQTAAKTPVTEESLDQDRGTDIAGAKTHCDVSSTLSGQVQDQGDGEEQGQAEEHINDKHGDRGSSESVGSGSSFEELDLVEEMVEELERELGMEGREEEGLTVEEGAKEAP